MAENKKKYINIGLDIGTTSVGWSIIDEDYNIVDMGVRLFDDIANPKNGTLENHVRRDARNLRRQIRRKQLRKRDFLKLLIAYNFVKNEDEFYKLLNTPIDEVNQNANTIIDLKVLGLKQKLTNDELILCLLHYINNRGYFYQAIEENKDEDKKSKTIGEDDGHIKFDPNVFPSLQIQKFYDKYGFYRDSSLTNQISHESYWRELNKFLEIQKLDKNFTVAFINIFDRQRKYNEGPGSEKSPTPYGLYRLENGKVEKIAKNLWDLTVGKCTVYPDQNRGGKNSPVAQLFNWLNMLNNMSFSMENKDNAKFNKDLKENIAKTIGKEWESKGKNKSINLKLLIKIIKDYYGVEIEESNIRGYIEDKDKKPKFEKLDSYLSCYLFLKNNSVFKTEGFNIFEKDILLQCNDLYELIRENLADKEETVKLILKKYHLSNDDHFQQTINDLFKKLTSISATHSLSYKAMEEYIFNCGVDSNENQMHFFNDRIQENTKRDFQNKDSKYIPAGLLDDEIISPTVRKSYNQAIAITNKLMKIFISTDPNDKKPYLLNNITIELARDKNSVEEKKNISKKQKENEEINQSLKGKYVRNYDGALNSKQLLKLKLLDQQDGKDIYTNESIDPYELINDEKDQKFNIDHIIPFSFSGDNSLNNKVITSKTLNQKDKKKTTPYQQLNNDDNKWNEFMNRVKSLSMPKAKKENLLFMGNLEREEFDFTNRNLVDTRYTTRSVLNVLQGFFKTHKDLYPDVKIKSINGKQTNYARYNLFKQPKDRAFFYHHAIDATIISFLGMFNKFNDVVFRKTNDKDKRINIKTGEIFSFDELFNVTEETKKLQQQMENYKENKRVKFSRKVESKNQIQLFDQTRKSYDTVNNKIIEKVDLLSDDVKVLSDFFGDNTKKEDLLCFTYDKKMYDKLNEIYKLYISINSKQNPFKSYMNDLYKTDKNKVVVIGKQAIRFLKYYGNKKTIDSLFYINKGDNNAKKRTIVQNLNALSWHVYKTNKGKYIIIPINAKFLTYRNGSMRINDKSLKDFLVKKDISDFQKYININRGDIIVNNNDLTELYISGAITTNNYSFELKALNKQNEKRIYLSINKIIESYSFVTKDVTGIFQKKREIF